MKRLLLPLLFVLPAAIGWSQCSLTTLSSNETITCGDCATLSAFGNGSGNVAFQEDFNSGSPTGWQFTQTVTIGTNTCGVPSPDGSPFMWMGDASVNPRDMETVAFDLTLGGTICFEMRYSIQGDPTPCEGPDEPDEGVYLQYSTDGGTTWQTIQYYDPNGGNDPTLTSWNQYCAILPPGALTTSTMIRWHQDAVSGAEYDHWGIDNVVITLNDPSFQITWLHDNYSYGLGSGGGNNPTPVCPQNTTTYTAQISNGTNTCTSSVMITVVDPTIIINAGNDTTVCPGDCATVHATAYELVSPASTPTFENAETSAVFSGDASMNINVQGLNATTITPTSITSICLNGFNFSGSQLCTSFGGCNCNGSPISFGSTCNLDVSSFNITVTSPGGCQITLVPAGMATGTSYQDVCFVPAGGQSITLPSFPTPGNWNPQQPFSVLNGCQSNGVWTMEVNAPGGFGFGAGFLSGWSISFDDPEITAPVNFTWSPTTNMTNTTTLTPTICPVATTTYTLSATDTDGCITVTDNITVTVGSCCALTIDNLAPVNPSCSTADGSITATVSGQITGLQFSINNGATFQSSNVFSNLAAGTYTIQAIDDNNCLETATITLTNASAPTINSISQSNPSCGASDGDLTVTTTGGTGTITFSINGGPQQASSTFGNLAPGNYTILAQDQSGCTATMTALLANSNAPVINSTTPAAASCGASDGSIAVNAGGGTGTLQYSDDNGTTFQAGSTFSSLAAGNYDIVVEDASGCQTTTTVTVNSANVPTISNVTSTPASCGNADGTITVTAAGGTGTLQYSDDNGVTFQAGTAFSNLAAGNYDVVVQDASGCQATATGTIINQNGPVVNAGADQTICLGDPVTLGASGAVGFTWDNGVMNNVAFSPAITTTYTVTGTDANGCTATDQVVVTVNQALTVSIVPSITSGCAPLTVTFDNTTLNSANCVWQFSNGQSITNCSDQTITFNTPGCYDLTLTAASASGCMGTATFPDIVCVSALPNAAFSPVPGTLTLDNTVSTMVNGSTGGTAYIWDFGDGSVTATTFSPIHAFPTDVTGSYTVTLTTINADGCMDVATGTVVIEEELIYFVPNAFTPDGDEFNQLFLPVFTSGFDPYDFNLQIYNRWGEIVFESNDSQVGWDGTYSGKLVPEGVYTWRIEFKTSKNDKRMTAHGHLSVLK